MGLHHFCFIKCNFIENWYKYIQCVLSLYYVDQNQTPPEPSLEEKINFTFDLSAHLNRISRHCQSNRVLEAYLTEKQKLIFEALSPYQSKFDVGQIKFCNALGNFLKERGNIIAENQEGLESLKKRSLKEENDEIVKKLREALDRISINGLCLVKLDSVPSSGCFIATAAYSTSTHPDIDTFRNFRDEKLLPNPVGKRLVSIYYQISPSIAQYLEKQPALKSFVRQQLGRLAQWMRSRCFTGW